MLERDWKAGVGKILFLLACTSWQVGPATALHPSSKSTWYSFFPHSQDKPRDSTSEVPARARQHPLLRGLSQLCCLLEKQRWDFTLRLRLSSVGLSSKVIGPGNTDLTPHPPAIEVDASCTYFLSYLTIPFLKIFLVL